MAKDSQPDSKEVRKQKLNNSMAAESESASKSRNNKKKSEDRHKQDEFIEQVKNEYASIASNDTQQHFHQTSTYLTPKIYYENLLEAVIKEISKGTFDHCHSGAEIVDAVAADKTLLSEWKQLK